LFFSPFFFWAWTRNKKARKKDGQYTDYGTWLWNISSPAVYPDQHLGTFGVALVTGLRQASHHRPPFESLQIMYVNLASQYPTIKTD
jgi:hypothetical protein